jgi:hypothetical protein
MDHDHLKENWSRATNRYCDCPAWRYNPRYPKPTNPNCQQHGGNNVQDQRAEQA